MYGDDVFFSWWVVQFTQRDSDSGTGYDARMRRQVVERQAADLSDNKDGVKIYIGFLFDGVTTYRNISETLPQQGQMYIYDDPEMYEFEDEVMDFRRNDEQIVIQVIISSSCYNASLTSIVNT